MELSFQLHVSGGYWYWYWGVLVSVFVLLLPAPAACSVYEFNFKLNQFEIVTRNEIVISIKCKGVVLAGIMSVRMKTFIK